ncbi:hypothetical protein BGZ65_000595 [Modicella reniformis]|uniref:Uncharacterized protein n=1 Tax=Modicella reniformis TaxID=1440133 RepID=A0A9P6MC47_9FUNG|nr:hypothetical protein BGZ65_000595 [Modicella reniformis]
MFKRISQVIEKLLRYIKSMPRYKKIALIALIGVIGGVTAYFAILGIVTALGFTAAGIVAGTPAAAFMASYGGVVTAGSLCAILQSFGALGVTLTGIFGAGGVGLTAAAFAAAATAPEKKEDKHRG